jgi:hypothetical protein
VGLSIAFSWKNIFWDMSQKGISFFSIFSIEGVIDRVCGLAYTEYTPQNMGILCQPILYFVFVILLRISCVLWQIQYCQVRAIRKRQIIV